MALVERVVFRHCLVLRAETAEILVPMAAPVRAVAEVRRQ